MSPSCRPDVRDIPPPDTRYRPTPFSNRFAPFFWLIPMGSASVPLLWYRQCPFGRYLRNTYLVDEFDSTMPYIVTRRLQ